MAISLPRMLRIISVRLVSLWPILVFGMVMFILAPIAILPIVPPSTSHLSQVTSALIVFHGGLCLGYVALLQLGVLKDRLQQWLSTKIHIYMHLYNLITIFHGSCSKTPSYVPCSTHCLEQYHCFQPRDTWRFSCLWTTCTPSSIPFISSWRWSTSNHIQCIQWDVCRDWWTNSSCCGNQG